MQLNEALTQIAEIRSHVERAQVYRGYRSVPVMFSGLLAVAAGGLQAWLVQAPLAEPGLFVSIWLSAAVLSVVAAGGEIATRYRRTISETERARTRQAVGQFLPCLLAGGLLTTVMWLSAPDSVRLLPGIWCMLFSLGIFASLRVLPRGVGGVAVFYLLCGLANVMVVEGEHVLAPWTMAIPFGVGQLWVGGILYWKLERNSRTYDE